MADDRGPPTPEIAEWMRAAPPELRSRIDELHRLVRRTAHEEGAWPLVEEIKWGQPSFRSPHGNESTPIRLGWTDDGDVALLAHCQSRVIPEFQAAFGEQFRFDGTRAVLIDPSERLREAELAELIRHALTYRRR